MVLMSSGFEEWQNNNLDKDYKDYDISLEKMNKAGALFDLEKLNSVNNNYLSRISNEDLYFQTLERAKMYDSEFAVLMESDKDYTIAALSIERHTEKDPKRFTTFLDVKSQLLFFYDKEWELLNSDLKNKINS
jgi:glutamyl-tRNA synthetase